MDTNNRKQGDSSKYSRLKEKRAQVLAELCATLNTLAGLQQVLEDIVSVTEVSENGRSVASKQEALLEELKQWQSLRDETEGG